MDSSQQRRARSARDTEYGRLWASHPRIFARLEALEERLGHRFGDRTLLYEALTHRSALMELAPATAEAAGACGSLDLPWNERLEFLGDAVLGLAVSGRLMAYGDALAEGDLSRIRAALVNEASLAELARALGVGDCLVLGKGAAATGGRGRDSLLADGLEALVGAVFVDGGFAAADAAVGRILGEVLAGDLRRLAHTDFKTMLQELTQEKLQATPTYEVVDEAGPDHAKTFEVKVLVGRREVGRGHGASKKRASQAAARRALDSLRESGWI